MKEKTSTQVFKWECELCMCLFWEWLLEALPDSHVILGGQPTVGSVVAIESVFQVNVGLPNEIIGTHEVMVEYSHSQLWLGWEGDAQLQDPGQEGKVTSDSSMPSEETWAGSVQPSPQLPRQEAVEPGKPPFPSPGPSLTLQRWGSVAWGCSVP